MDIQYELFNGVYKNRCRNDNFLKKALDIQKLAMFYSAPNFMKDFSVKVTAIKSKRIPL
ncbi:hypothetical protein BH23BAC2_BH23BAC2_16470 [soil metagenome]